jgi:hypothetical protein
LGKAAKVGIAGPFREACERRMEIRGLGAEEEDRTTRKRQYL